LANSKFLFYSNAQNICGNFWKIVQLTSIKKNSQKTFQKFIITSVLTNHSVRKLFTGLVIAAFIAWKLIVAKAIKIESIPVSANTNQEI